MELAMFRPGKNPIAVSPSGWGRVWVWLSVFFVPAVVLPIFIVQGWNGEAAEAALILWMVAACCALVLTWLMRTYLLSVLWMASGFSRKELSEIRRWVRPLLRWIILLSILTGFTYWLDDAISSYATQIGKRCVSEASKPPSAKWIGEA